jgi:hypothetical protein
MKTKTHYPNPRNESAPDHDVTTACARLIVNVVVVDAYGEKPGGPDTTTCKSCLKALEVWERTIQS